MAKRGRPSKKTDALCEEIAKRISEGEPLAQICRDDHMPHATTANDWMNSDEAFSLAIARARNAGYDLIAANLRSTARGVGESTGDIQRDKLIIETDLKLLAKWDSKRYGDKLTVDGQQTVKHSYDLDRLETDRLEQLEAILALAARDQGGAGETEPASVH